MVVEACCYGGVASVSNNTLTVIGGSSDTEGKQLKSEDCLNLQVDLKYNLKTIISLK